MMGIKISRYGCKGKPRIIRVDAQLTVAENKTVFMNRINMHDS